ncbi:fibropellin-3-like [Patiria miniata]|uniref:EGF-like domain-containing protein n=1 Tax=Patiria miniata TaxID=46514 RepID=A0A913Z0J2_PATMI|nr:fibropellin-3-like [Patiria miniata]
MGRTGQNCDIMDACAGMNCNFGSCFASSTTPDSYFCQCNSGYTGRHCDSPVNDPCSGNPCPSSTVCVVSGAGYTCNPTNPCTSVNCNNGRCFTAASTPNGYICVCDSGYTGMHCESQGECKKGQGFI